MPGFSFGTFRMAKCASLAFLLCVAAVPAHAAIHLLAESDVDAAGGSEVFLRTYATLNDLMVDNKGPGGYSALDVGTGFSIAGFTYDGQYHLLAESDVDAAGGSEVFLRTYATLNDLMIDNKGPGGYSALDVGTGFSIVGFTYDGQYHLLAESDVDAAGGSEVFLRTYATLNDLMIDNKGPGGYSALDVGTGFSIVGFSYDGQYHLVAESDVDAAGGSEVFLRTYATLNDLMIDNKGPGGYSALDVGTGFSIVGMTSDAVASVPEPGTLALLGLGISGLAAVRRRRLQ